jgi:hypothetical protein
METLKISRKPFGSFEVNNHIKIKASTIKYDFYTDQKPQKPQHREKFAFRQSRKIYQDSKRRKKQYLKQDKINIIIPNGQKLHQSKEIHLRTLIPY